MKDSATQNVTTTQNERKRDVKAKAVQSKLICRKLLKTGIVSSEFVDIKAIDPGLKKELGSCDRRVKRSEPQIKYLQTVYK